MVRRGREKEKEGWRQEGGETERENEKGEKKRRKTVFGEWVFYISCQTVELESLKFQRHERVYWVGDTNKRYKKVQ